jgi:hypothetical protein
MTHDSRSSTRRALLASSAAGAAALALRNTAAQSGTPEAGDEIEFLFVQAASNGTLTGSDQGYTLAFQHGPGQTVYFSDRPIRLTGLLPTAELVAEWPFEDESPPNAALAISNADDAGVQVLVGVLSDPVWNPASATLSYSFSMLTDDIPAGSPTPIPDSFESATLFIDGSPLNNRGIIVVNDTGRSIEIGLWKEPPR